MSERPRFVVAVFDALRPDMVTPATAPNIAAFAAAGCRYANSRAVFPSETRVNTASFATGAHPAAHGIVANSFFDPVLAGTAPFNTGQGESLRRADAAYPGGILTAPALGEVLHAAGLRFAAASSGTAGNARFLNPRAAAIGQSTFSVHGPDACSTTALHDAVTARFGPVPPAGIPNLDRVRYVADVLIDHLLPQEQPDVAVVWFSEPDISYHYRGIGSPESLAAIRAVDTQFARILDWRDAQPDRDRIQIITLSDHGQIATGERLDLIARMGKAGFAAAARTDADIACVPGYAGNVFVPDGDGRRLARLTAWMQEQPWCGLLLTVGDGPGPEGIIPGTFALRQVGGIHARAPHLVFTLRSDDAPNAHGYPGGCIHANPLPSGGGIHGGAHARELANFLVFGGSLFGESRVVEAPCDITSLAPTILRCLGLTPAPSMTGRVLDEALGGGEPEWHRHRVEAGHGAFRQHLDFTRVGDRHYLDSGGSD